MAGRENQGDLWDLASGLDLHLPIVCAGLAQEWRRHAGPGSGGWAPGPGQPGCLRRGSPPQWPATGSAACRSGVRDPGPPSQAGQPACQAGARVTALPAQSARRRRPASAKWGVHIYYQYAEYGQCTIQHIDNRACILLCILVCILCILVCIYMYLYAKQYAK